MARKPVNKILYNFSVINWFFFVVHQEVRYRRLNLKDDFLSLFSFLLIRILKSLKSKNKKEYALECCEKMNPCLEENVSRLVKRIRKHFFWGCRVDFRFLLALELLNTLRLLGGTEKNEQDALSIITEFLELPDTPFLNWTNDGVRNCIKDLKTRQSLDAFIDYCFKEESHNKLPVKNIAVCATMSAGKSTFVNALLGRDVLPAKNEATTAKITSVYDKDGSDTMVGFIEKDGTVIDRLENVDCLKLNQWNDLTTADRIFLQGDLDNIGNRGFVAAVHDTPGTNNSGDKSHLEITMHFLEKADLDAVIYVANAEHLCTTDEKSLLTHICDEIVKLREIPILFILNKADNIDREKEKLEDIVESYRLFLKGIGFENETVMPVSSKGARLLKMALNGRSEKFTEAEMDLFPSVLKKFVKRLNFSQSRAISDREYENDTVLIDGVNYDCNQLKTALSHTGIERIEKTIEKLFNKV